MRFGEGGLRYKVATIKPTTLPGVHHRKCQHSRRSFLGLFTHPGVALLWVPTLGGAPARAPGGCVFEERVGMGGRNALGWVH